MRFDIPDGSHIQALKDITLELKTGELMSVLGPSGCGKSTLLNIVAGFMAPTEGKLTLNNVPITQARCGTRHGFPARCPVRLDERS